MTVLLGLFYFSGAFATEVTPIDLGNFEVKGEVRRPMLESLEKSRMGKQWVADLLKEDLGKFEKRLTSPGALTPILLKESRP